MAHHWIFINSAGYRRFIQATNERKGLLFTSALGLAGASLALGYAVINFTNPDYEQEGYKSKQAELSKLPMHSQVRFSGYECSQGLCAPVDA